MVFNPFVFDIVFLGYLWIPGAAYFIFNFYYFGMGFSRLIRFFLLIFVSYGLLTTRTFSEANCVVFLPLGTYGAYVDRGVVWGVPPLD